jgi:putative mRNA 3-end processing factor
MLELTDKGLFCPLANIYIDPWKPVSKAVITHAHADHARWGHQNYLSHPLSEGVMRHRLGNEIHFQGLEYGEKLHLNGVQISLHPAGHIPGSAQIRLEHKGEIWVVSGDYKLQKDGLSTPFEAVTCYTFITECTFGLPVFQWPEEGVIRKKINDWWKSNALKGMNSVIFAYALGKAQRILKGLDNNIGPILVHGAVGHTNHALRSSGMDIPEFPVAGPISEKLKGACIIAPPSAQGSSWLKKFQPFRTAMASGWMNIRGTRRRRAVDQGFIMSDHADWDGLNSAVRATGAQRIYATHGYTSVFVKWLQDKGYEAYELETQFLGENAEGLENTP